METAYSQYITNKSGSPPYSLGKLVEWKRECDHQINDNHTEAPYSLGKLVEWKPSGSMNIFSTSDFCSLLAREIS